MKMKKAQGLLETIVALGVIITGLVSVMSLVISNLNNQRDSAMRYQAVNLARQGIEIARNIRDSNWLAGKSAWEGIQSGQDVNVAAPFKRVIKLESKNCDGVVAQTICDELNNRGAISDPVALSVISEVKWQQGGREGKVELKETLYDWR